MDDEEEESEYLTEDDIKAMISEATAKISESVDKIFGELAELNNKSDQYDKRMDKYERRMENIENRLNKRDEAMFEIPVQDVVDAIGVKFVDQATRNVTVRTPTTVVKPSASDPRKTKVPE